MEARVCCWVDVFLNCLVQHMCESLRHPPGPMVVFSNYMYQPRDETVFQRQKKNKNQVRNEILKLNTGKNQSSGEKLDLKIFT